MSRWALRTGAGVLGAVLAVSLGGLVLPEPVHSPVGGPAPPAATATPSPHEQRSAVPEKPLHGLTIALDPGHQLGVHNFPAQADRLVPAGGFEKPCQTTGTETDSGVPEATVVWRIVRAAQARLTRLGATVRLTRTSNSEHRWGPCVDVRGRFGGRVGARLTVSVHADGAGPGEHGFHVIVPARTSVPHGRRTARPSLRLAKALRAGLGQEGFARSSYIGDGTALSIRTDLATLNLSVVPVAMIEIGNMRNAHDAAVMTSRSGRARYAEAIVTGIRRFLRR
ncbi:MAG TPA: N-acetylmuramoyl-L-alanine amidase [Marmoricola sp.]|nr:N-acetylmuramoyl-L-alanine amidase [Marmoricola sp.]